MAWQGDEACMQCMSSCLGDRFRLGLFISCPPVDVPVLCGRHRASDILQEGMGSVTIVSMPTSRIRARAFNTFRRGRRISTTAPHQPEQIVAQPKCRVAGWGMVGFARPNSPLFRGGFPLGLDRGVQDARRELVKTNGLIGHGQQPTQYQQVQHQSSPIPWLHLRPDRTGVGRRGRALAGPNPKKGTSHIQPTALRPST